MLGHSLSAVPIPLPAVPHTVPRPCRGLTPGKKKSQHRTAQLQHSVVRGDGEMTAHLVSLSGAPGTAWGLVPRVDLAVASMKAQPGTGACLGEHQLRFRMNWESLLLRKLLLAC